MPLPEVSIRKSRGRKCIVSEKHKFPTPFSTHCDSLQVTFERDEICFAKVQCRFVLFDKSTGSWERIWSFHQIELGLKLVSLKRAVPASTLNLWVPVPMRKCYFPPKQKHTGKQCVKKWLNVFCGFMACSLSFYNTVSTTGP